MSNFNPDSFQPLCVHLAVSVSDWLFASLSEDIEVFGGISSLGQTAFEQGCRAMVSVGVYEPISPQLNAMILPPDAVEPRLRNQKFTESQFNALLLGFCYRSIEMTGELGGWGETFPAPAAIFDAVAALCHHGFMKETSRGFLWSHRAIPWLFVLGAVHPDELEKVSPEAAKSGWASLPQPIKSIVLASRSGPQYHGLYRIIAPHLTISGWAERGENPDIPTMDWDMPLVLGSIAYGQSQ